MDYKCKYNYWDANNTSNNVFNEIPWKETN